MPGALDGTGLAEKASALHPAMESAVNDSGFAILV
jgi:hypothetical protein